MEEHDALKQELLAREKSYWAAIKEKNSRVAANLSDDPCIVVGAQGVALGEFNRVAWRTRARRTGADPTAHREQVPGSTQRCSPFWQG